MSADDPRSSGWLDIARDALPGASSARQRLSRRQRRALIFCIPVAFIVFLIQPRPTLVAFIALSTIAYLALLCYRLVLLRVTFEWTAMERISDEEALALPDDELPVYTIMVPAYREPEVLPGLLDSLGRINYPADRLDVKLLLEADDVVTIDSALLMDAPARVEVVIVPDAEPKTKPKALNYGLCSARGELVTIYDAEDHPEPLQLRRAAAAMRRLPETVACLQARLVYHNPIQNLLTRWFSAEYLTWFSGFLPGLVAMHAPLPLGGTSNHFRRHPLDRVNGWDPFNVTEDADLGLRLHRMGYQVRVLDSVTWEEANSDIVNWLKQRSRWYKGYLQTWLVHMRHPIQLKRDLSWKGFFGFTLFVGGTPLLAALNPLFWILTLIWFISRPELMHDLFPGPVLYLALISFALGNLAVIYAGIVTARREDPRLVLAAFLSPLYWGLMSLAAAKAVWQLLFRPSHWEKTTHGLSSPPPTSALRKTGS